MKDKMKVTTRKVARVVTTDVTQDVTKDVTRIEVARDGAANMTRDL